jgi:hypothetical protein
MSSWTYTASNEANLMKIKYGKLIDKQFNMDNVLFGRINKKQDFVGKQIERPVIQSIGGGVGAGSLPTANENKIGKATLTTKKLYAVTSIDRETMKAAKTDEGAFVRMTKFPVKIATKSFNRNLERMITRAPLDESGTLITGSASNSNCSGVGSAGDPYFVELDQSGVYSQADIETLEVGDLVNVNTEATALEVVDVIVSSSTPGSVNVTVSLVGSSARLDVIGDTGTPAAFAATDKIYMQGSKDNELSGLEGILQASSGSYKGISIGRRWQSYNKQAASAALSTDLMNDVVINIKRTSGESPSLILTSFHQYTKLLNLLEDHKRYPLPAKSKDFKGQISFNGVEYMSPDGAIPVIASRFVSDDNMLFLNDKHIELCCRPGGFEWFDEDGTVFLRESTDSYEARYGGYCDFFVNPHFQGILSGLAV